MENQNAKVSKPRYSIDISLDHRERLAALAKEFKINQGEAIEVLLDTMDKEALTPHFQAKRAAKIATRQPKTALLQRLKALPANQLEAVLAAIEGK